MKTIIRNFLSVVRRFKMATFLNIIGLSVAFTAVTVIMMQVTYDLGYNSNQPESDNIYRIDVSLPDGRHAAVLPRPFIENFKATSPHIKAAAFSNAILGDMFNWFFWIGDDADRNYYSGNVTSVSEDFVNVFQFDMIEGSADKIKEPDHVIIPESLAKNMFGDKSAIQQYIMDENVKLIIGGVYKDFPANSSTKNYIYTKISDEENKGNWNSFNYEGYVLVESSARIDDLLTNFTNSIDPKVFEESGLTTVKFEPVPLKKIHFITNVEFDSVAKVNMQTIWVLIAIAFVILLIAAINFTNYSIALTPLRIKSLNTQKVLGATEKRLRYSLLLEAVLTCIVAWGLSVLITHLLSMTSLSQILNADMALSKHIGLLSGVFLISLAVGLFAGLYPAYYITSFAPALVLKGSFGLSPKGRQLRNMLVGIQFIASFALIVVSCFMYLQITFMQRSSLGFDKDRIIVTNLNNQLAKSKELLTNELMLNPAIESVSFAETVLSGLDSYSTWSRKFKEEDRMFQVVAVDTGFFRTMGIPLLEGRDFTGADLKSKEIMFVFNEKARDEFGLSIGDKTNYLDEVIGFMPNITVTSLRKEMEPMAFMCANPDFSGPTRWAYIRAKAGSDMKNTMGYVENTLHKLSAGFPFNIRLYDNILNNLYASETNLTSLITWFSLIAVLISMVGVFGLVVFESEYKRKEIGVRKVLGSTTTLILAMFNMRYIRILVICFVIAAPIAWIAVSRWLENFSLQTPLYWWVFLVSFLLITAITIATVTFQSWRVANANPVDSIKTE